MALHKEHPQVLRVSAQGHAAAAGAREAAGPACSPKRPIRPASHGRWAHRRAPAAPYRPREQQPYPASLPLEKASEIKEGSTTTQSREDSRENLLHVVSKLPRPRFNAVVPKGRGEDVSSGRGKCRRSGWGGGARDPEGSIYGFHPPCSVIWPRAQGGARAFRGDQHIL